MDLEPVKGKIEYTSSFDDKGIKALIKSMDGVHSASKGIVDSAKTIGLGLTAAFGIGTAAVAAFGAAAVNTAADFEQGMSNIGAVSGATAAEMKGIHDLALKLGAETAFSASEAAAGIEELIKGGLTVEDVMSGAAKATLDLAAAGGVDLAEAATISANAMAQFGIAGKDVGHVADLIAGAANASATDVSEFGFALKQAGAVASTVGFNFDDLAQGISVMAKAGITGSDAGTSLKTMMLNLQPTTDAQVGLFRQLGLLTEEGGNAFFDAAGKVKSLSDVSQVLQTSLAGMSEQQRIAALETMFGSDAIRAGAILAKEGAAGFDAMASSMSKVTAASVGASKLDNVKGSMQALSGTIETGAIMIGEAFLPVIRDLIDGLNSMLGGVLPGLQNGAKLAADRISELILQFTGAKDMGGVLEAVLGDVAEALGLSSEATDDQNERMSMLGEEQATSAEKGLGFQRSLDKIRDALADAWTKIEPFLKQLQSLGKWLLDNKETVAAFAKGFAILAVVGSIVGPIASLLSILTTLGGIVMPIVTAALAAVGIAAGPLLLVVGALVGVFLAVKLAWENDLGGIKTKVTGWIADLKKKFEGFDLKKVAGDIIAGLLEGFRKGWTAVVKWFNDQLLKLPAVVRKAFGIRSPSTVFEEIGANMTEGLLLGLRARYPDLAKTIDELLSLMTNRPDFQADYARFWADILDTGMSGIEQLAKWVDYLGSIGDDTAFNAFGFGDVGSAQSYNAFGVGATEDEMALVNESIAKMREQQAILKDGTKSAEEHARAQGELERVYGRLVGQLKSLEDARYAEAKAALEKKKAEGGGSFGDSALLAAMFENLENHHNAVLESIEDQAAALGRIIEDEGEYAALVTAYKQRIIDLIEEQRDAELDAAEQVHDSVLEKLEAEAERREAEHERRMQRFEDLQEAEDARHEKALQNLDDEEAAAQAQLDADEKRIDDLRWKLKQMEHAAATDPATAAAQAAITVIDEQIAATQAAVEATIDLFAELERIDPRDSSEKRQAASKKKREVIGLSSEQMAAVFAQLDNGIYDLTKREQRVLSLLAIGKRVNADEVEALLTKLGLLGASDPANSPEVLLLQAQRTEHQKIIDARQTEIDLLKDAIAEEEFQAEVRKRLLQPTLDAIEARRKAEEERHRLAIGAIAAEQDAEAERWGTEKARLDEIMDLEDQRHKARMRAIQEEYALELLRMGKTDAEVKAILEEQARRAKEIANDAMKQYEEWLKLLDKAPGLAPVAPGAGGAITPPVAPPGIGGPARPGATTPGFADLLPAAQAMLAAFRSAASLFGPVSGSAGGYAFASAGATSSAPPVVNIGTLNMGDNRESRMLLDILNGRLPT